MNFSSLYNVTSYSTVDCLLMCLSIFLTVSSLDTVYRRITTTIQKRREHEVFIVVVNSIMEIYRTTMDELSRVESPSRCPRSTTSSESSTPRESPQTTDFTSPLLNTFENTMVNMFRQMHQYHTTNTQTTESQ